MTAASPPRVTRAGIIARRRRRAALARCRGCAEPVSFSELRLWPGPGRLR